MSNIKNRITKLEVITLPTMERFILGIGLETFKTMLDYLQEFVDEAKAAPRVNGMVNIEFNPPEELRGHIARYARITGAKRILDALN